MLHGANLFGARLQGAQLSGQPVGLVGAQLQGAYLREASLQGADLRGARLQGADLRGASLQGADLSDAQLQGADLRKASLHGADLRRAELQAARLDGSLLWHAVMRHVELWRATGGKCDETQVVEPQFKALAGIERSIEETAQHVPEQARRRAPMALDFPEFPKRHLQATLRARLISDAIDENAEKQVWQACEEKAPSGDDWQRSRAASLAEDVADLACRDKYVASAIAGRYAVVAFPASPEDQAIARRLLGLDGDCPGTKELDDKTTQGLRRTAGKGPSR
jgi:Pentapeptide repeats (8 copies)